MSKGFWEIFGFGKAGKTRKRPAKGQRPVPAKGKGGARSQALEQIRANQEKVMTPEREQLIRHAMHVRRAKQQVLQDLDDEQRQKLVATAMRAFLNEGRKTDK